MSWAQFPTRFSVLGHLGSKGQFLSFCLKHTRYCWEYFFSWSNKKNWRIRSSVHCSFRTKKLITKHRSEKILALNYTFLVKKRLMHIYSISEIKCKNISTLRSSLLDYSVALELGSFLVHLEEWQELECEMASLRHWLLSRRKSTSF